MLVNVMHKSSILHVLHSKDTLAQIEAVCVNHYMLRKVNNIKSVRGVVLYHTEHVALHLH